MSYEPPRPDRPAPARRSSTTWIFAALIGAVVLLGIAWGVSSSRDKTASRVPLPDTSGQGIAKIPLTSTSPVAAAPPSTTPAKAPESR